MASSYQNRKGSLTSVALVADVVTKKMTSDTTFKLSDYKYTDSDSSAYCKYSQYNSGTWASPLYTGYTTEDNILPFIDALTAPKFYMVVSGDTCSKQFPITDSFYGGSTTKYIAENLITDTMTISYDSTTGEISIKIGSTNVLQVKASPYILVDVQARGGDGGSGTCDTYATSLVTWYKYQGGGSGGGAGAFASLSANLTNADVTITQDNGDYIINSSSNTSTTNSYLKVGKGENGGTSYISYMLDADGWATFIKDVAADGGAGGVARVYNKSDTVSSNYPTGLSLGSDLFIIGCISGGSGGNGNITDQLSGTFGDPQSVDGTRGNAPSTNNIALSSSLITVPCYIYNTTSTSAGGLGEQTSQSKANTLVGGGGGGASLMSNGASHGQTSGIGAGGFGGSAWTTGKGTNEHSSAAGSYGGGGAVWVYYVPSTILDPIITNLGREADGGDDIWNWSITNRNSFPVVCHCTGDGVPVSYSVTIEAGETHRFSESNCGNFNAEAYFTYSGMVSNTVTALIN